MSINPQNLFGTAKLTYSQEFDTLHFWDGKSGLDTRPGFAMQSWADHGFAWAASSDTWYVQPSYAQTASLNPFSVSDGVLTITAQKMNTAVSDSKGAYTYASGVLTTYHEFAQTYGYFEIRAQTSSTAGALPAFWLLPADGSWPPELDVMEIWGSNNTTLFTSAHSQVNGSIKIDATHQLSTAGTKIPDASAGFHTYGVDWQYDKITWYFDGKQIYQIDTPADMHKPMYMIANLNIGGDWEGRATADSANFKIDYIRAYTEQPNKFAPVIDSNGGDAKAAVTVQNNKNAVTTVHAKDADGTAPLYKITGGADASLFSIDSKTGALVFKEAPNYSRPHDAGGDNVYDVIVAADDGIHVTSQSLAISVSNVREQAPLTAGKTTSAFEVDHYDAGWKFVDAQKGTMVQRTDGAKSIVEWRDAKGALQSASVTSEVNGKQVVEFYDGKWQLTGADVTTYGVKNVTEHYDGKWQRTGSDVFFMQGGKAVEEHYDRNWKLIGTDVGQHNGTKAVLEHYDAQWHLTGNDVLQVRKDALVTEHYTAKWAFSTGETASLNSHVQGQDLMKDWLLA